VRGRRWEEHLPPGVTSGSSGVEVVGQGLVELEVRDGLEGRGLIEEPRGEIGLGRSAGGREVRRTHG
jgi:hypothetical protein